MWYSLVVREDEESKAVGERLEKALTSSVCVRENPDVVIAIGGDGTMVKAFQLYHDLEPYFVCVGTGTLGFYADWSKDEVEELASFLETDTFPHVDYPLLETTLYHANGDQTVWVGLNELVVKSNTTSTFIMNTYLNDSLFQSFRGDGMVFATPSGSTAYNHSLMGSIIHPSFECVQMSELAAINNSIYRTLNRSLVLPKHHVLRGEIVSDPEQVVMGVDGQKTITGGVVSFEVRVAEEKVRFLRYRDFAFWKRVKEKFL